MLMTTKRRAWPILVAWLAITMGPWAEAQDKAEPKKDAIATMTEQFTRSPVKVEKLSGHVYALTGPGGNITALVEPGSTLIVDSGFSGRGEDIAKAVKGLTEIPIKTVVNTHWHFDHTGNNAFFADAGAKIMAHPNVTKQMSDAHEVAGMKFPASPKPALPTIFISGLATMKVEGETIDFLQPPLAHTDGDTAVFFRKANVLSTGDLYSSDRYPYIEVEVGGWIGGLVEAYDLLLSKIDANTKIVPGHGPVATRDDLVAYRKMLATVRDRIEPMIDAGKTVDQIVASQPTRDIPASFGQHFLSHDDFTRLAVASIVSHRAVISGSKKP